MTHYNKHFILTLGRSGSNTLVDIINQHPQLLNYGEVLGEWNKIRKLQRMLFIYRNNDSAYLDLLIGNKNMARTINTYRSFRHLLRGKLDSAKNFNKIKSIGVKDFSLNMNKYNIHEYLIKRNDIKVVGLERNSILDRFISYTFLKNTGVVLKKDTIDLKIEKANLDTKHLINNLRKIRLENDFLKDMLGMIPSNRIYRIKYEDLYSGSLASNEIIRELYKFLGVDPIKPVTKMQKILPGGSLDRISNIADCREVVKNTEFRDIFSAN